MKNVTAGDGQDAGLVVKRGKITCMFFSFGKPGPGVRWQAVRPDIKHEKNQIFCLCVNETSDGIWMLKK